MFDDSEDFSPAVKTVGNNVVSISGKKVGVAAAPVAQPSLARLPAPVHRVREKASALLQQGLKALFDNADDALFDLADKATSNQDQNIYFEAMREVRLKRRETEKNFYGQLDKAYADLLRAVPETEHGFAQDLTSDDLSLVEHDQLEFQVAVESMITKVLDHYAEAAQHIALRLDSLVPAKVFQRNNPVGPHVLCHSFWIVIEPLDVDIKAKLVLLKLFDKAVMAHLGKIYDILNNQLIQDHVLPSLMSQAHRRQRRQEAAQASRVAEPGHTSDTVSAAGYGVNPDETQDSLLGQLRDLLASVVNQGPGVQRPMSGLVAQPSVQASAGAVVGSVELASVLTALQQKHVQQMPLTQPAAATFMDPAQLTQLMQQPLGQNKSLSAVDQDVMNLINMLFQFILDDRNLAAPMQSLLARLQIPMLKVAVVDKSFFNRSAHPARRLLNELATAALGWQAPENGLDKDPLFKKIASTVESIIADFDDDVSIFDGLLTDFVAFVEKEQRRATVLEKRTVDAEDGKAKSEFARAQVSEQMQGLIRGRELPACVREILDGPWHNLMFLLLLKNGTDSEAWKKACQVVEDLTWSVTATMDAEARKQLMSLLPGLLKSLRQGFEVISYSPFEMNKLLQQLEAEHLRRMRGQLETSAPRVDVTVRQGEQNSLKAHEQTLGVESNLSPIEMSAALAERPATQAETPTTSVETPTTQVEVTALRAEPVTVAPGARPAEQTEITPSPATVPAPAMAAVVTEAAFAPASQAQVARGVADESVVLETNVLETNVLEASTSESSAPEPAAPAKVVSAAWLGQVDRFAPGSWFEVAEEERPVFRCRLAAVIKKADKYIFVNRNGMKVAEKTRLELAQALEQGTFNMLDDGMLFDRALESVISNLRKSRS